MKSLGSVLLVDDDSAFRMVMAGELERLRFKVTTAGSGEEALSHLSKDAPDVVLLDLNLPGISGMEVLKEAGERSPSSEVIMLTGHGSIDTAIDAIRIGASDYISKPCPLDEVELRIKRALERRALRRRTALLERGLAPSDPGDAFIGESPEFQKALDLANRVAPSESTILITGETGSGKEMAAKLIHARSARRDRPFVVVECAALQEDLLQSELFGHEKGAFTGADRSKPGLFEVADGGTIFLDEIGEVNQATQVKLLRALDTSTFRHVGGTEEIRVDVRVLAATNRDLERSVTQGHFREDLFYRLSTIILRLPPLRARGDDVSLLSHRFVERFNRRFESNVQISPGAEAVLKSHHWPGNVRELLHVIERAMVVCEDGVIQADNLPIALRGGPGAKAPDQEGETLPSLAELERAHVERVLRSVDGHRGNAARILGISERNLYRKLRDFDVS
jgi:two-component system response regulator HydG